MTAATKVFGTVLQRVWSKVEIRADGCWRWTAATTRDGYPMLSSTAHKTIHVHRWVYEQFVGPIPAGFTIDHLCGVTYCVNPNHLEAVSNAENTRRRDAARTRCRKGHPYTADTVRLTKRGRICLTCEGLRLARARQRKKGLTA